MLFPPSRPPIAEPSNVWFDRFSHKIVLRIDLFYSIIQKEKGSCFALFIIF